jgi:hypothetical protein
MNKLLKNTTLSVVLLTTTFQTIPSPFDWIFVAWFFGSSQQQQENPDQAPAGVTTDSYIAQFRSDLNGQSSVIPLNEMQEMEAAIRQELRNVDLRNKDNVNQIIRSVVCNQVKIGTIRDLDALKREGFYITADDYTKISSSNESNMFARLERMPHLNGAAIAQYFGETRKHSLRNSLINRTTFR